MVQIIIFTKISKSSVDISQKFVKWSVFIFSIPNTNIPNDNMFSDFHQHLINSHFNGYIYFNTLSEFLLYSFISSKLYILIIRRFSRSSTYQGPQDCVETELFLLPNSCRFFWLLSKDHNLEGDIGISSATLNE